MLTRFLRKYCFSNRNEQLKICANIKNQLFKLSETEIKQFQQMWTQQAINPNINKIHQELMNNLNNFQSISVLKSVGLFYAKHRCNDQHFWSQYQIQMSAQLSQIKQKEKMISYLFQVIFILGQVKRQELIKDTNIINYKTMAEQMLQLIITDISKQSPQNITHVFALIKEYNINNHNLIDRVLKEFQKIDYTIYNEKDIVFLLWTLRLQTESQIIKFTSDFAQNQQILEILINNINFLDAIMMSKLIIVVIQLKIRNKELIDKIVNNMPQFELKQLVTLIAIFIKSSMKQLSIQLPIFECLTKQFNNIFLNDKQEISTLLEGIKFIIYLPCQIPHQKRIELITNFDQYGEFILSNIDKLQFLNLVDALCMARLFKQEKQILGKVKNQLLNIATEKIEDYVFLLYNLFYYKEQFEQEIEYYLKKLNNNQEAIKQFSEEKYLQYILVLELYEQKYPIIQNLLKEIDEKKIQKKLQSTLDSEKVDQISSDLSFQQNFKYYQGFMQNNFEFNLYLCQKKGVFKYFKESRVGNLLIDYRLYNIDSTKFDLNELKIMQQHQGLLQMFLNSKDKFFDDVTQNRINEKDSIFIELDGINHQHIDNQETNRTIIKKYLLNKYGIKAQKLNMDEKFEVKNSLKSIQDLLNI